MNILRDKAVLLYCLLSYNPLIWLTGELNLLRQSQWIRLSWVPNIWSQETKRSDTLAFYLRVHRFHAQEVKSVAADEIDLLEDRHTWMVPWAEVVLLSRIYIESINSTHWRAKSIAAVSMGLIRGSRPIDGAERRCVEISVVFYLRVHWFSAQERRIRFDSRISINWWSW